MSNQYNPKKHPQHYNTPGHAHELTFICYHGRSYLSDPIACEIFMQELLAVKNEYQLRIWAYVLMPTHVHLLIWPLDIHYSISKILDILKGKMAKRYRDYILADQPQRFKSFLLPERGRDVFRFWQRGGGYDRNLWDAKSVNTVIAYIEANPVKKNLVSSPELYPWSSAFARANQRGLIPDQFSMPVVMIDY